MNIWANHSGSEHIGAYRIAIVYASYDGFYRMLYLCIVNQNDDSASVQHRRNLQTLIHLKAYDRIRFEEEQQREEREGLRQVLCQASCERDRGPGGASRTDAHLQLAFLCRHHSGNPDRCRGTHQGAAARR